MVRTGVVKHPSQWKHSGYNEIQKIPQRKGIVDIPQLMQLCHFKDLKQLQASHRQWVEDELAQDKLVRNAMWSESIAVGNKEFVENTQQQLGVLANGRTCGSVGEESFQLKEDSTFYHFDTKMGLLRPKNTVFWDD